MKPSGIAWIGDIPESWSIQPLKYISDCNQKVISESTPPTFTFSYIDIGSVTFEDGIGELEELIFEYSPSRARRVVAAGDTIISTVRTYLKAIAYVENSENIIASTGFAVYTPGKRLFPKYLYYFCISEGFVQEVDKFSYGIAYPAINTEILSKITVAYPELLEQTLIADFLDEKCAKIDSIVTDLEKQIDVLQKYKKSLITETVTKGLDKSVTMKDSGIEWIGGIPEEWGITKVKYIFNIVNGSTPDSSNYEYWDGDIKWITPADMKNTGLINAGERAITSLGYKSCGTSILPIGSIIISSRAPIGKINVSTNRLCTNQGCKSLVRNTDNRYYYYYLVAIQEQLILRGRGTTFLELGTSDLGGIPAVLLSQIEQILIADFLDKQCTKIDSIIKSKKEQLTKITQHKKSLIYEYVTGKRRVKGANNNGN